MAAIFVSYRRADASASAGRICDRLQTYFGDHQVFQDVDTVPLGVDFRDFVAEKLEGCDVLLAIIGDSWLGEDSGSGIRRIDRPDDLVRLEVETALQRDIPIIPVLVGMAPIPSEEELPACLAALSYRNGVKVRSDASFEGQVAKLIAAIEALIEPAPERPAATTTPGTPTANPSRTIARPVFAGIAGTALIAVIALLVNHWLSRPSEGFAELAQGQGFSFAMEQSVGWDSADADILVGKNGDALSFFLPNGVPPPDAEGSNRRAVAGIDEAPSALDEDDCSWDYDEDYRHHWFSPTDDGVYCVLDRYGDAVAKIWITDISASAISFEWTYFSM